MKLNSEQLAAVKAFALKHYDDPDHRYDFFVECYEESDWQSLAKDCKSIRGVYALMKDIAAVRAEQARYTAEDF